MFHVEHQILRLSNRLIMTAILSVFIVGCKSENPNPELMDPIYSDLKKDAETSQKDLEAAKKELEEAKLAMEKADPNTIELRNAEKSYWKSISAIKNLEVLERYLKIRAERRRVESRQHYRKAFKAGKDWPDPAEYSDYLINKRLRSASLNWNRRVPKLEQRVPASKSEAKSK